jgi:hypothetical protein
MAPTDDEGLAPRSVSAPCQSSSKRIAEPQAALKMGFVECLRDCSGGQTLGRVDNWFSSPAD